MSGLQNVSRADLFERVWSTPMRKLAVEFGISDVGLAKICRKNGIPLPGIGSENLRGNIGRLLYAVLTSPCPCKDL